MRSLLVAAALAMLLSPMAYAAVWGSARSKVYHHKLCRWNAQIRQEYKVVFASPLEARKAGYQPCETCRPPGIEPVRTGKPHRKS